MRFGNACPKCQSHNCQSHDILRIAGNFPNQDDTYISTGWFGTVEVVRYVCACCGFCEEWIEKTDNIEALRRRHRPLMKNVKIEDRLLPNDETDQSGVASCPRCNSALVKVQGDLRCLWCEDRA